VRNLRDWLQVLILWTAKMVCIYFIFSQLMVTMRQLADVMKGNGTSGFLQAAVLSVPQLFSSLGGIAVRWRVVVGILPFIATMFSGYIVTLGETSGVSSSFADLAPSAPELFAGWQLMNYLVPVTVLLRMAVVCFTAVLALHAVVFGAVILTDATSKA